MLKYCLYIFILKWRQHAIAVVRAALRAAVSIQLLIALISMFLFLLLLSFLVDVSSKTERHNYFKEDK